MRVYVNSNTQLKLWKYIESLDTEIGGMGYAFINAEGDLDWVEAFLVPQVVTHGDVEFNVEGMAAAVERGATDGVLDEPNFIWVSWHSHHSMKAFWSPTDKKGIKTYGEAGIKHLLSFVGCHDHDYLMRYDAFNVEHAGLVIPQVTMDGLKLEDDDVDPALIEIRKEIAANVRVRPKVKAVTRQVTPAANYVRKDDPGDKVEAALARQERENGYVIGAGGVEYDDGWPWGNGIEWDDPDEADEALARMSAGGVTT